MAHDHDHDGRHATDATPASSRIVPGKRSLTAGIQPRAAGTTPPCPGARATPRWQDDSVSDRPFVDTLMDPVAEPAGAADPHREAIRAMGARFGHDFSQVEIVDVEPGALGSAVAVTAREQIRATRGSLDQGTADGRFLLAHELTHVVQQRGGSTAAAFAGTAPTDLLEAEADDVATRVAGGDDAGQIRGRADGEPLAFSAIEHMRMGDEASGHAKVRLAPDYVLTFGEVVAMAGDHFSSFQQMVEFAKNTSGGAHSRLEIEWVRKWQLEKPVPWIDGDPRYELAKAAAEQRYYALAGANASHFVNPKDGDTRRSTADKALDVGKRTEDFKDGKKELPAGQNAVASYRANHQEAIRMAATAGKIGTPIAAALAQEAFGAHYLSDSFAGGHIRTARLGAKEYWDAKVPMFFHNLQGYMAQQIARYLRAHQEDLRVPIPIPLTDIDIGPIYPDADRIDENRLWKGALVKVQEIFKKRATLSFGDVVALALHDRDNENGVIAHVQGERVQRPLKGDGKVIEREEKTDKDGKKFGVETIQSDAMERVKAALKAGINDVEKAYALGAYGNSPTEAIDTLFDPKDRLFAPERHVPVVTKEDATDTTNPELRWKFASFTELLADPAMQAAIKLFLKEKAGDLESVKNSLEGGEARALGSIAAEMLGDPRQVLTKVIEWTPDTGGGFTGADTDDQAEDYIAEAARTKGGMTSLTITQRVKLLRDLLTNGLAASGVNRGWSVLDTAADDDARAVLRVVGWDQLDVFFRHQHRDRFRARFPRHTITDLPPSAPAPVRTPLRGRQF